MIRGWTERTPYNFIRAGVIRLGEKGEKGAPKKLNHFVVPEEVAEIYGSEPKALDIVLPDEEEFIQASLKRYDGNNKLICHGDGQTASVSLNRLKYKPDEYKAKIDKDRVFIEGKEVNVTGNTEDHLWAHITCPYKGCTHYKNGYCKETVMLYFVLTKVPGTALQTYTITTRSYNSFHHLILGADELRKRFGRCSFIPVQLKVKMEEKQVPGKQFKNEVPILYLDFEKSYEEIWEQALQGRMIMSFTPVNGVSASNVIQQGVNAENDAGNDENIPAPADDDTGNTEGNEDNPLSNEDDDTDDERVDFLVLDQPQTIDNPNRPVAKCSILLSKTQKKATLGACDDFVKSLLSLNKDMRYRAKIIPVSQNGDKFELKEMLDNGDPNDEINDAETA